MEIFTTTSHSEIRMWVESRGGHPAVDRHGVRLRIDFDSRKADQQRDTTVRRIPWDDFFRRFDEGNMQFVYQNAGRDGVTSRYYRIMDPREDPQT